MNKIKIFTYFLLGITMFYFLSQKKILKENFINKNFGRGEIVQNTGSGLLIKFKVLSSNYDIINIDEILELETIIFPNQNIRVDFSRSSKPLSNLYESYTSSSISGDSSVTFNRSEIKNNIFNFRVQGEDNDFYFSLQPIQIRYSGHNEGDPSVAIKNDKKKIKRYIYGQFFTRQQNDGCYPNPCENGGRCVYGGICNCVGGWHGDTCSEYHPCLGVDCGENGTCINENSRNDGTCNCDPGYLGDNCEIQESNECLSSYCLRYTEPTDLDAGLTNCLGSNGNCGEGCDTLDNRDNQDDFVRSLRQDDTCLHCLSIRGPSGYEGCGPHGRCSNNEECICNDGFSGDYCENDACNPNPCQNGGECVRDDSENRYHCLCPSNKRGVNCERDGVIPCTFRGLEGGDGTLPENTGPSSERYKNKICTYRNFDELPEGYSIHTKLSYGVEPRQIDNIEDMNPIVTRSSYERGVYEYRPSELGFRTLYCRGPPSDEDPDVNSLRTDFNTGLNDRQTVPGQDILHCAQWQGPTRRHKNLDRVQEWPADPNAPTDFIRDAEVDELFYANCCKGIYERE